jgi:hypothetical protein
MGYIIYEDAVKDVPSHLKEKIDYFIEAIKPQPVISFPYESKSGNRIRAIELYMLLFNKKVNIEIVGLEEEQKKVPIEKRETGHYLIS